MARTSEAQARGRKCESAGGRKRTKQAGGGNVGGRQGGPAKELQMMGARFSQSFISFIFFAFWLLGVDFGILLKIFDFQYFF